MYRVNNMPNALYKYYSLSEGDTQTVLDTSKLNTVINNKIWLSNFNCLNDPFEYKYMYLDKQKVSKMGYPINFVEQVFEEIRNEFIVTCFTKELVNNMPMWAHYANNHHGFCIEYKIKNKNFIFPVLYETRRYPIANNIINYIIVAKKLKNGEITPDDSEYKRYVNIFLHNALIKHKSWEYEGEYRLIYFDSSSNKGKLLDITFVGLEYKAIYIGKNCNGVKRNELIQIAKEKEIELFDMELEEMSEDFKLKAINVEDSSYNIVVPNINF